MKRKVRESCDLVVVGAGPCGCRVAKLVAERGFKVVVLERKRVIGTPEKCAGLVSKRVVRGLPEDIILNRIERARFYCGWRNFFEVRGSMFVINRRRHDLYLFREAKNTGVYFKLGTRFLGFDKDLGIVFHDRGCFSTNLLVGADGPISQVARSLGMGSCDYLVKLLQLDVKIKLGRFDVEKDRVELWFQPNDFANDFAWVVPLNEERAKVGIAGRYAKLEHLQGFVEERFGERVEGKLVGDVMRVGIIPSSVEERVLLVGDAACQVKPFSFGGLAYGKLCSKLAAKACVRALESMDFSREFLTESYELAWKRLLSRSIEKGFMLKKAFEQLKKFPSSFSLIRFLKIPRLAESFLDVDFL